MYFRGSIDALDGGMIEMVLDPDLNKTGDIWHICIEVSSIRLPRLWPCLGLSVEIVVIGSVSALKYNTCTITWVAFQIV